MGRFVLFVPVHPHRINHAVNRILVILAAVGLLSGCVAKVQMPAVDEFHLAAGPREGVIDAGLHGEILLNQLYDLMKTNEGLEVPICTADRNSRQCVKDGIRVFVMGGIIPGVGKRTAYVFNEISLDDRQLEFTKENGRTTFIGTPMLTRSNKCRVHAAAGGLQVDMAKYYANWAGIGNMFMAEGWAIDYMDLNRGIVGLQLELDIKGYLTTGGGSRYVLLKFPKVPESLSRKGSPFTFLNRDQGDHAGTP